MRVALKPEVANAPNVRGWLTLGKQYTVLSVEATGMGASGSSYRIESDDNNTPALFETDLFHVVDPRIPSCWIVVQHDGIPIQLMPPSWASDGYWERFFEGEPSACGEYESAKREILIDLGQTEVGEI